MGQFEVYNSFPGDCTLISNRFLEDYMPKANGEFVKIYLYLLGQCQNGRTKMDLSSIADTFNCTETDILRAFRYWKESGLLDVSFDQAGNVKSVRFSLPEPKLPECKAKPSAPAVSRNKLRELKGQEEVRQLLFIAEQYLGRTLTPTDVETLLYLYDEVHISAELLEYLIEYCVSKGSPSMAYIKKVGLSWAQRQITTVSQAKEETNLYNKNYFTILRAFGISNRNPLDKEIQYMNLWLNQYGFTLDIIAEACSRTVLSTGKASFSYADSILESWFKKGVRHLSDIDSLDVNYQQKKNEKSKSRPKTPAVGSKNKFNNFHQRNYNMAELEKQLLGK